MMAHAGDVTFGRTWTMHMALQTRRWTRADLERLPDDGNTYELIHGELLVSPAPRPAHEEVVRALRRVLEPYCDRERIGRVYDAKPAFVTEDSEVIPDIVIRPAVTPPPERWDDAPMPVLVVEVLSESTLRADRIRKRAFYLESGIPEYWIVDGETRTITVARPVEGDTGYSTTLTWHPAGASIPMRLDVGSLFREALGAVLSC